MWWPSDRVAGSSPLPRKFWTQEGSNCNVNNEAHTFFYLHQYAIRTIFFQTRIGLMNICNKSRYTNPFTKLSAKNKNPILSIFS